MELAEIDKAAYLDREEESQVNNVTLCTETRSLLAENGGKKERTVAHRIVEVREQISLLFGI
jgi:hypothetical protein